MIIKEFHDEYCNKNDICWQLDMAAQEGFNEEEMLSVCFKCTYFKENQKV